MQTPVKDEVLDERKWSELTVHEKSDFFVAFLNDFGKDATLDKWRDFLKKRQVKDI